MGSSVWSIQVAQAFPDVGGVPDDVHGPVGIPGGDQLGQLSGVRDLPGLPGSPPCRVTRHQVRGPPDADEIPAMIHAHLTSRSTPPAEARHSPYPASYDRYRDRHGVTGKKSDAGDALVLAQILRTDLAAHRPLPADSELAQAIAVLARAQQDAVWERTCAHNKLRSLLREYYPALLVAAPAPREAAQLTHDQLCELLVQGRQRGVDAEGGGGGGGRGEVRPSTPRRGGKESEMGSTELVN